MSSQSVPHSVSNTEPQVLPRCCLLDFESVPRCTISKQKPLDCAVIVTRCSIDGTELGNDANDANDVNDVNDENDGK